MFVSAPCCRGYRNVPCLAAIILLAATVLTACADRNHASSSRSHDVSTSQHASVSPDGSQGSGVDRLASPVSYSDGEYYFDVAPSTFVPKVTSTDALTTFTDTNIYSADVAGHVPQIFVALLTDYERSTQVDSAGKLLPSTSKEPVWVVRYSGVAMAPIDAGVASDSSVASGVPTQTNSDARAQDILAVVDAVSGTLEEVLTSDADPQAIATGPSIQSSKK